ncbi:FecR domain-containing protein [Patescibacteria group bacterium]|nr:FecR domain-containing protein [Patescibacteria group bacterium]
MNKITLSIVILGAVIAAVIGTLGITGNLNFGGNSIAPPTQRSAELHGELVYATGEVYKRSAENWIKVEAGEIISEKDSLKTNGASRATVLFDDGSIVRLTESSEIEINEIQKESIIINVRQGEIYNRVAKIDNRTFQVFSGDVLSTALGTAFLFGVGTDEVMIRVVESKVKVVFDRGEQEIVQGEKLKISSAAKELKKESMDKVALSQDDFVSWNKVEDEKLNHDLGILNELEKNSNGEQTASAVNSINLSVTGTKAEWTFEGTSAKGFKVVWSKNQEPKYPVRSGDKYLYLSDPNAKFGQIDAFDGSGTYYVRVCEYLGAECGTYSNQVSVQLTAAPAPEKKPVVNSGAVTSLVLNVKDTAVSWTIKGFSAKGFKVVWSKNSNPTYPTRIGDKYVYYSNPETRAGKISAFDGSGTYYVRVCEYLGGKCGLYSNQVKVELTGANKESAASGVNSISLNVSGTTATWTVDGYSASGFKLVWSKNSEPTYPTRSGDKYEYYSDPATRSGKLSVFDGTGTYYVRVCEYLGGKCGKYSNQTTVNLE